MSTIHAVGGRRVLWLVAAIVLSTACGDDDTASTELALIGTWTTTFGSTETISSEAWTSVTPASGDFEELRADWAIVSYDNASRTMIRQASPTGFFPNTFDRTVWVDGGGDGSVFVCTETFNHDTADQAVTSTKTADASDPESGGCDQFSWTKLTP